MSHATRMIQARPRSGRAVCAPAWHLASRPRGGFTLIELLITILIIGILAGLFFGALQRAGGVSKIVHTKSTIAKLNVSLMDRWDSYRSRRLPIDPKLVLATIKATGGYPYIQTQITAMSTRRVAASTAYPAIYGTALNAYPTAPYDPLSVPTTAPNYPSAAQVAAVRLLAMRELMQYEMPCSFADFADMSGTPGSFLPRAPQVLTVWPVPSPPYIPPVAQAYLRTLNSATTTDVNAITANQSAECLYMILTIGSTDSGLFGEQLPTADVSDVDGDGLLEFQDSWPVALNSYTPKGQANAPIDFLRWAPGFVSDLQPNPSLPDPTAAGVLRFSLSHHDFFDPLRLDIPDVTSSQPIPPRGVQLTPLIYSAGPDGNWGLALVGGNADPYDATGVMAGTPNAGDAAFDNIINHELDTRSGK